MKNWTIGKRISLGFGSVILIAAMLGAFSYTRLAVIAGQSNQIANESVPAVEIVMRAQRNAVKVGEIVYKHIGSQSKEDMTQLESLMLSVTSENTKVYEELEALVTSEKGRSNLEKTKVTRGQYIKAREATLELSRQATNNAEAYRSARTQMDPAAAQYLADLDTLVETLKGEADASTKGIQAAVQSSRMGILAGLSLALIVGIALAFAIARGTGKILFRIASALEGGSNQVVSAAGHVASSSQSLSAGASEQAASIEETSASLEEIASMTKRNAENSQKANDLAKEARASAEKGASDMQSMSASMEAIKTSSDDIAKIIKTIDDIAFQTNILALNAAVEAARAGEAGMGFAVVADEVRSLAQRCAQAASETSAKIEGAIGKTAQGVEISAKVAVTLGEIVNRVRQVDELVAEVAGASREQSQGIGQITTAMSQMDKVTQANAAGAEESASASEELNAQAEAMKASVVELLDLVGQAGQAQAQALPVAEPPRKAKANTILRAPGKTRATTPALSMAGAKGRFETTMPSEDDFKNF